MARKLRENDVVIVIAGKDKGKTGKILRICKENKAIVEGVNIVKKHQKPTQNLAGGIVEKNLPIHLSNLAILNPASNKADKVGFKVENNKKVRFFKSTGETIK